MSTDVLVAIISGSIAAATALLLAFVTIRKDVKATRFQVQNSHSTNLRDDIDALHRAVRAITSSVEGLREEMRQERRERLTLAEQLEHRLYH